MRQARSWVPVGLVLSLVASGCIGSAGPGAGALLVSSVSGIARILHDGGEWESVAPGGTLAPGDVIEVGVGGSLALDRGASTVEVRAARDVNAEVRVESVERLEVGAGQVLVNSDAAAPIMVGSDGITAQGEGVYRFDRSLSVRVGVYEGAASIGVPAGELAVPRLRQGVIAGRVLPRAPDPLRFSPNDEWDMRFLSEVLDLDRKLAAHRRGYEAEFGRRMRAPNALSPIAGDRSVSFMRAFAADHDAGDLLVALVLSLLVESDGGARLPASFRSLMALREAGATWGLLAFEHDVEPGDLITAVVRAIGLRTGDVEQGTTVTPTPPPTTGGGPTPGPEPSRSPKPKPSPKPSPSPSPSPSEEPSPSPSPTPTPCPLPAPLCPDL